MSSTNMLKPGDESVRRAIAARLLEGTYSKDSQHVEENMPSFLLQALRKMDPEEMKIIGLRCFESKSSFETAEALGLSASDTRRRFVGAMTKLNREVRAIQKMHSIRKSGKLCLKSLKGSKHADRQESQK